MQSLIRIRNLSKSYHSGKVKFKALNNIDLNISRGQNIAIIGKSGSGKSTLLNMITGLDKPTSGQITIGENEIGDFSEGKLAKWRGENIGIVFQFFQLLPTITILDNLLLAMDFVNKVEKKNRKKRAMKMLEMTGIEAQAYKYPSELSGGEKQRAAISRALVNDPDIIVADEPTGNLDSKNAQNIRNIFKKLNDIGKTVITVTHDQIEDHAYDRVIELMDGKII